MRGVVAIVVCVGLTFLAPGHAAEKASASALLEVYVRYLCTQVGTREACRGNWSTFVQAGMNDIDMRCDNTLAWLDARRRDRKPILAEISGDDVTTQAILTPSGTGPKSFDALAVAFGLTNSSKANEDWLQLTAFDHSTIQTIMVSDRLRFRSKIKNDVVLNRPAAIGLLSDYLRLCMPAGIMASIDLSRRRAPGLAPSR